MSRDEAGSGEEGLIPPQAQPGMTPPGMRERMEGASLRIPMWVKLTVVWIAIFGILAVLFILTKFDTVWMRDNVGFLVAGLWVTVVIAVAAIILAIVMALLGALGRLSKNPIALGISGFYTSFFRGTPLIVQMLLIYLALPQMAQAAPDWMRNLLLLEPVEAGILALGLNYGAYMTEIFRAGIQSVSHGQVEAAQALGMTYRKTMRRVVFPQAFRVIVPPTGNEFIAMVKDTALVSFLGASFEFMEMFRRAQLVGRADFRNLEALVVVAVFYWILTAILTFFQARLERRLSRGYVRSEGKKILTGQGEVTPASVSTIPKSVEAGPSIDDPPHRPDDPAFPPGEP